MHFDPILGEARGIEPTPTPSEGSQNFPDLWAGKDESNPTEDFLIMETILQTYGPPKSLTLLNILNAQKPPHSPAPVN